MAVEFKTDAFLASWNDLNAGLRNGAHQALVSATTAAFDSARTTTLFKDGPDAKLRKSIRKELLSALSARVVAGGPGIKEAKFIENGTPPHVIEARGGPPNALKFTMNGQTFFRRRVNHPGTAERPFMAEAAKVGEQALDYGLEYFTERPIAHFNNGG
jgi:hypothetical protein